MKYQKPKGTADILPPFSKEWQFVEQNARETFALYNYEEIRTPIFEKFEVFSRSAGDTSDIVTKEMYDFDDKVDATLRYAQKEQPEWFGHLLKISYMDQNTRNR
ncbi:Histidine--tRNA ligase [Pediococcus pentosaceus]|nr:Histidine--tRNA ligase [Pediococcus pentosaceus]